MPKLYQEQVNPVETKQKTMIVKSAINPKVAFWGWLVFYISLTGCVLFLPIGIFFIFKILILIIFTPTIFIAEGLGQSLAISKFGLKNIWSIFRNDFN